MRIENRSGRLSPHRRRCRDRRHRCRSHRTTSPPRARALHKQSPLIDGHNDYPWALRDLDPGRDFAKADITGSVPKLMTDIPRLRQGGIGGQFWSVYVPSTMQGKEAVRATLEQIDIVHRMMRRWPETFVMARTAAEVERAFKSRHASPR